MTQIVKSIRVQKTTVLFDPNVFECFVPRPTRQEKEAIIREVSYFFAYKDINAPAIYITRIFRDDFEDLNTSTNEQTLKVLVTHAGSPILEITKVELEQKNLNYPIAKMIYHSLEEIPNLLSKEKKLYYAPFEKGQTTNEAYRIEAVRKMARNAIFVSNTPPLPRLASKPTSPKIISAEEVELKTELLEKRFGLEKGVIENTLTLASTKRKEYEDDLVKARDNCIQPIETDLEIIRKIMTKPQIQNNLDPFDDEEPENFPLELQQQFQRYAQKMNELLNAKYLEKKFELLQLLHGRSSEAVKFGQSLERTASKVKSILKEYKNGHVFAQLNHIKQSLIWSLYHAAIMYLNESWTAALKQFPNNWNKIKEARQLELNTINESFKGFIHISSFCQISSVEVAYKNFDHLSLAELSELIHQVLIACDKTIGRNSTLLECVVKSIREMNDEIEQTFNFKPFNIPNSYLDKTGFYFAPETQQFEEFAQTELSVAQDRLRAFDAALKLNLSASDVVPIDLSKIFEILKKETASAIESIKSFEAIILLSHHIIRIEEDCVKKLKLIDENQANTSQHLDRFDQSINSVMQFENQQFTAAEVIHNISANEIESEKIRTELNEKISNDKNKLNQLFIEMHNNKSLLDEKKYTHQLNLAAHSNNFNLTIVDLHKISELLDQFKANRQKILDNERAQNEHLADLQKLEALFKIPFECERITHHAKNIFNQTKEIYKLNDSRLLEIDKNYEMLKRELTAKKNIMRDPALSQLNQTLKKFIDAQIKQIDIHKKNHLILLFTHALVNDLLNLNKWRVALNGRNISKQGKSYKVHKSIYAFLKIIFQDKRFKGWTNNPLIAENLLIELKNKAVENSAPNALLIKHLYNFLFIPPLIINEFSKVIKDLKLQDDMVTWISENNLNMISFPLKKTVTHKDTLFYDRKNPSLVIGGSGVGSEAHKMKTIPGNKKGFFKRHWRKILAGSLIAGFIIGGIFTCGILALAGVIGGAGLLTTAAGMGVGAAIVTFGIMITSGTAAGLIAAGLENQKHHEIDSLRCDSQNNSSTTLIKQTSNKNSLSHVMKKLSVSTKKLSKEDFNLTEKDPKKLHDDINHVTDIKESKPEEKRSFNRIA